MHDQERLVINDLEDHIDGNVNHYFNDQYF